MKSKETLFMLRRVTGMALIAIALAWTWGMAAEEEMPLPEGEVPVQGAIAFVNRNGRDILGDLYTPPQVMDSMPAVVFVHGGGFVTGSRKYIPWERFARILANHGFVVWNVDYRLLNEGGTFPALVNDMFCAVKWLKGNAGEYGVDPDRVAIMGASAGGYLAAFVAVAAGHEEFHGECGEYDDEDPSVTAAVVINGVFDLGAMKGNLASLITSLFYKNLPPEFENDPEKLTRQASPINYVESAVPILMFHGDIDVLVPVEQSRAMAEALKEAGREVIYLEFPGKQHGFISEGYPAEQSVRAVEACFDFLDEKLAGESTAE